MMTKSKGIPEGIRKHWLPILTGYAYLLTYMYYHGYLSALRLPHDLIEVSLTHVLSVAASLLVFSMPLFLFIDEVINYFRPNPVIQEIEKATLPEDEEKFRPYLRSTVHAIFQYSLVVAYLMLILWFYGYQWKSVVFQTSIFIFLLLLDIGHALGCKARRDVPGIKWYLLFEGPFALLAKPHQPFGMLKQWIGDYDRFVILALLGIAIIWQWGNSKIYRLNCVWTSNANGEVALVSRYGENLVCVPVVHRELVLSGQFSLIKIADSSPIDFKQTIIEIPKYHLFSKPKTEKEGSSPTEPTKAASPSIVAPQCEVVPQNSQSDKAADKPNDQLRHEEEPEKATKTDPVHGSGASKGEPGPCPSSGNGVSVQNPDKPEREIAERGPAANG